MADLRETALAALKKIIDFPELDDRDYWDMGWIKKPRKIECWGNGKTIQARGKTARVFAAHSSEPQAFIGQTRIHPDLENEYTGRFAGCMVEGTLALFDWEAAPGIEYQEVRVGPVSEANGSIGDGGYDFQTVPYERDAMQQSQVQRALYDVRNNQNYGEKRLTDEVFGLKLKDAFDRIEQITSRVLDRSK